MSRGTRTGRRCSRSSGSGSGNDKLDFLFVDGDHTYEGVAQRPPDVRAVHVRPGGFVAFHDIAPDFNTRYGVDTGTYAGGVPQYWAEVKPRHARCTEIVDHRLQDGRGIGLIELAEGSGMRIGERISLLGATAASGRRLRLRRRARASEEAVAQGDRMRSCRG